MIDRGDGEMDSLKSGWLSLELESVEADVAEWSEGIRDSFNSLRTNFALDSELSLPVESAADLIGNT